MSDHPKDGIVLGRAFIRGSPTVEPMAPPEYPVKRGRPFRVILQYRVEETSRDKETYRFRLESRIADHRPQPAEVRHDDRYGWPDDVWGFLDHTYTLDKPGRYQLEATLRATYNKAPWSDADDEDERSTHLDVKVGVIVS